MKGLSAVPIFLIAIFTLASCGGQAEPESSSAAAASAPSVHEDVESVITQLEREWVAAIVNKDFDTLERVLANDFVGTSPTAHTFYKDMAIADLKSGAYTVESMDLDEVSVNAYGDTAVAFTSQEEKSKVGGEDTSGHYHFTNFWIKRNGVWQVVASHGSRFAQPHPRS
jgi:ketosteroid isomerase-like protein